MSPKSEAGRPRARAARVEGGSPALRRLVGCAVCRRQYDARGAAPGSKLRCLCGELLTVAEARGSAAPVARCAACGGPREPGAARCGYCQAAFAASERERNTICPTCAARIADAARYCPACGTPIDPQPLATAATPALCPACGPPRALRSRKFPDPPANVLECSGCGGLWLSRELWSALEQRARREAAPELVASAAGRVAAGPVVYRDCPVCRVKMHRRNYGGTSGAIVDLCARHGLWFDADELANVLAWIRRGGAARAERAQRENDARRARERRLQPVDPIDLPRAEDAEWAWPVDLADLAALLVRLFRRAARAG